MKAGGRESGREAGEVGGRRLGGSSGRCDGVMMHSLLRVITSSPGRLLHPSPPGTLTTLRTGERVRVAYGVQGADLTHGEARSSEKDYGEREREGLEEVMAEG